MKNPHSPRLLAWLLLASASAMVSPGSAADLIWDADGTAGGATGGTGTWSNAANLWNNNGVMQAWTGTSDIAIFGGTAGAVTVGAGLTAGGMTFNTGGYVLANAGNALTLGPNAILSANFATTATATINAVLTGGNIRFNPLVADGTLAGQGQFTIGTSTTHTGTLSIGNGVVSLNGGVSVASGTGITINGSGLYHPNAFTNSHPWHRLRQGLLVLNGTADQIGSQMVTMNGGGILRNSTAGGSDSMTVQNITLNTGFNTLASAPNGGAPNGDTLAITNLTRNSTATVEFRSTYGTIGANGDNGKFAITNLNGVPVANTNGILGGWAYTNSNGANTQGNGHSDSFATWDGALLSVKPAVPDKASNTTGGTLVSQSLSAATAADNWLANGVNGNNTISSDVTINSLIEQTDVIVNNNATLKLASGGFIMRTSNFWLQSGDATGKFTSTEANGKLYVNTATTIDTVSDSLTDLRIRLKITNNGATPVQLIKTGMGSVQIGSYNNGATTNNDYSGGTIIQAGRLQTSSTNSFGTGTVQVTPGGQAFLAVAGTYTNAFDLSGLGAPSVAGSQGAVRFVNGAVISGGVTLSGDTRLTVVTAGETGTISGVISGSGGLEKTGAGTLIASNTNTFTGGTKINGGIVIMQAAGALGSGNITVNSGGALDINGTVVPGSINVTIAGAGADGLGALRSASAAYGVVNNLTLSGDATIGGGAGRWDLGASPISINGGTFTLTKVGSNPTWYRGLSSTTLGNLVINAGQFGVEGNNDTLGSTAHTVTVNAGGELSSWGGVSQNKPIVLNGGTLDTDWSGGLSTWTGNISVTANSFLKADPATATVNLTGNITGIGGLTQTATTAADSTFQLSGTNSYSGATNVNGGILRAGSTTGLSSASAHIITSPGILRTNGNSSSIGSLAGNGAVDNTNASSATLTVGGLGTATTFSGIISDGIGGGTLGLTKTGGGSLTLTGINTYSGLTTVSQGLLIVNGELTASNVLVSGGGILGGSGKISAGATINGTLAPGNSPGILDFNNSALTLGSASVSLFEIGGTNPATDFDRVINISSFTLDGTWTISLVNGFSPAENDSFDLWDAATVNNSGFITASDLTLPTLGGGLTWNTTNFATTGIITVVPEPGITILGALAALPLLRRRRK